MAAGRLKASYIFLIITAEVPFNKAAQLLRWLDCGGTGDLSGVTELLCALMEHMMCIEQCKSINVCQN